METNERRRTMQAVISSAPRRAVFAPPAQALKTFLVLELCSLLFDGSASAEFPVSTFPPLGGLGDPPPPYSASAQGL